MTKKTASKSTPGRPAARARPARGAAPPARKDRAGSPAGKAPTGPGTGAASARRFTASPANAAGDGTPRSTATAQAGTPTGHPNASPAGRLAAAGAVDEATRAGGGAASLAERIVANDDAASVAAHAEHLMSDRPTTATLAARVLDEVLARKPDMLVPVIDKLVQVITSGPKRSVQTAAAALPAMARLAPARVARHLPLLTDRFAAASETGRDGLVATFAALCTASVAYQKRLEPVLELALSSADPKVLQRWTEMVLPALKGEPHARARAVVEERLHQIPRPLAQPIATFLGVKLRPAAPR